MATLQLAIPPVNRFQQRSDPSNGWSDHYGAIQLAHAYAGVPYHEAYFKAIWQHGCFGPWQDHSPRLLAYNTPNAERLPVYVAREDQAKLLERNGVQNVRAIGLPIVYTTAPSVERRPGSLLVFPTHTLEGESYPDRSKFQAYADEIAALRPLFEHIVVCIHSGCRKNGLWHDEFKAHDVTIIEGASTDDANALLRMRYLFERFEVLTTNGWGSHVAYALAHGCKVSIHGTRIERPRAFFEQDTTWAADRSALERALSDEQAQAERTCLKDLYREPGDAIRDIERGRWLIGMGNKVSIKEMRIILRSASPAGPGLLHRYLTAMFRKAGF